MPFLERMFNPAHLVKGHAIPGEPLPTSSEAVKTLMNIAWPSMLESVLVNLVSLIDTVMVGSLGHEAIAAVGLTTQPRLIVLAIFMSINVGVTAVVARRRGEEDRQGANSALRQVCLITAILAVVLSLLGVLFARPLIQFAGAQPDTIDAATTYFQIVIGGIFFNIMSLTINAAQRGCGNTRVSMRTNLIANGVNIVFNYLLIGGRLGFPRLGVAGAAVATTLGYLVAFLISLRSVRRPERFLFFSFKESFKPDRRSLAPVFNVGSSAAVEQLFMRVGFFIFAKIVASLGTLAFSTHQICINILNLSFAFGDGLGIASSSLVGQSMGRKRNDMALMYGKIAQRIGLMMACCLTVFFLLFRKAIILPFSNQAEIIALGSNVLIILAFMCPGQISQVIFSNCLRVAGDTRYVAMVSFLSIGVCRTVVAYLLCFPLGLGLYGAWISFIVDQYIRLLLSASRFATGRWMRIRL